VGYGRYGDSAAWRAYVDGQLDAAPDGSDKKALWLPAKGCTETLVPTRPRARPADVADKCQETVACLRSGSWFWRPSPRLPPDGATGCPHSVWA
jgi:hypothetical protein